METWEKKNAARIESQGRGKFMEGAMPKLKAILIREGYEDMAHNKDVGYAAGYSKKEWCS